jgi:hypothetical protein
MGSEGGQWGAGLLNRPLRLAISAMESHVIRETWLRCGCGARSGRSCMLACGKPWMIRLDVPGAAAVDGGGL